jgi:hypothetical protein
MQLNAKEQHCAIVLCSAPCPLPADLVAAGRTAEQQMLASTDHSINPLSEGGVLQRVLGYVGPGHWLMVSLVSKTWRESYLQVPEQQITGFNSTLAATCVMCVPRMTLLSFAVASAALTKLACNCGLPLDSSRLHLAIGRWGDIAALFAGFEAGMPQSPFICAGAAVAGRLAELTWLIRDQGFQYTVLSACQLLRVAECLCSTSSCSAALTSLWQQRAALLCSSWTCACHRVPACRGLPF